LAKRLGVSNSTLSVWEKGEVKSISGDLLLSLSKILGCSVHWLLTGKDVDGSVKIPQLNEYPFIEWPYLKDVKCMSKQDLEACDTISFPGEFDVNCFITKVNGLSMYPQFKDGELIKVNMHKTPRNNDYVVVHNKDKNVSHLRKLIEDGDERFLAAINPDYPNKVIPLNDDLIIIGVIEASYTKY
jgi:SOS-response transcriptional repressor LexA